jgi:[acyl-carrier-protein] S-malonyltransferase
MFSGQGAQKIGMGKTYYDNFTISKRVFDEASSTLGFDVARLCFEDKNGLLNQTEFAQPALLTVGIAAFRALTDEGLQADLLMGLSLGEYTALTAAGILNFADAAVLVHKRGLIMKELAPPGGMMAVIGLNKNQLSEICKKAASHGYGFAACANFNSETQIVISGETPALDFCAAEIKNLGGKAIKLKVSGPFHTPLMVAAAKRFAIETAALCRPSPAVIGVISNVTADILSADDLNDLPAYLAKHMINPVLWADSIAKAKSLGGAVFKEPGSGNTLERLVI